MSIYYSDEHVTVHHGDCLEVLATLPDASVDAVVTDPPYGLEFMGRNWDAPWKRGDDINVDAGFKGGGIHQTKGLPTFTGSTNPKCGNCGGTLRGRRDGTAIVKVCMCEAPSFPNVRAKEMHAFQDWCESWAAECLRVLKPGGHMLAFGGSRTWHRLAAAVEDAGFEIRDSIAWLYGSGFPKSLDVSKAIDRAAGAEREVLGSGAAFGRGSMGNRTRVEAGYRPTELNPDGGASQITAPATDAAKQWQGWGTALKPAFEPIVVGRKPLRGTVAANVAEHGTGALNIDACRVSAGQDYRDKCASVVGLESNRNGSAYGESTGTRTDSSHAAGRWPTNVVLDGDQADVLDRQTEHLKGGVTVRRNMHGQEQNAHGIYGSRKREASEDFTYGDEGGASRFFPVFRYEAKADAAERPNVNGVAHPTVKPLELMRWLVRLVTPPHGVVLDPFAGSGTTAEACIHEHLRCITIEREADYLPLIKARLSKPMEVGFDFGEAS